MTIPRAILVATVILVVLVGVFLLINLPKNKSQLKNAVSEALATPSPIPNPLDIDFMRKQSYPGSNLTIEQTLADGTNYHQYIASYQSQGLKINGLLTIPSSSKPPEGWPVIIFNHGYIPPQIYRTTERYVAYVDYFARSGYIVFKSDYRGNGSSEGEPEGAYYSPAYTVDVLNALASIKKLKDPSESSSEGLLANPNKIGMWGHSMGGNVTLRSLVVDPADIKVAVIWGGVVGTYNDLAFHWTRSSPPEPSRELTFRNNDRRGMQQKYGTPSASIAFWKNIDPNYNLQYIQSPVQLDAGLSDEEVPWQFSEGLDDRLKTAGKTVEFYTYPGADHNIDQPESFSLAMQRSLAFFDKYLK